jgi:hypothetical protein
MGFSSGNVSISASSDVVLNNPTNQQALAYDTATAKWKNSTLSNVDTTAVHLSGSETIAGIKTFSTSPVVPTPTNGTDAATKSYVDGKVGRVSYIDAADYGFLTTASASANDTAIAAAISAAAAAGLSVYVRGYTESTPYHISAPIDLTAGEMKFFGDQGSTTIIQDTDSATIVKLGGARNLLSGFKFVHNALPSATQGNGLDTYDLYYSHISDVQFLNCNTCFKDKSGFFFSNQMDTIQLTGFYTTALSITHPGNTGSVWNNIYINNQPYGTRLLCVGNPVEINNIKDNVFNQLNIEHCYTTNDVLLMNASHNLTINGLHIEQVHHKGWGGVYVKAYYTTGVIINGLSVEFSDVAPTGADGGGRSFLKAEAGAQMIVNNFNIEGCSNTGSQPTVIATTDMSGQGSRLYLNGRIATDIFSNTPTGNVFTLNQDTVNVQTGTSYTLTLDDLGKTIEVNSAVASTITIPPNSTTAYPIGTVISIIQIGSGAVTLAAGSGVTIDIASSASATLTRYATSRIRKRATDEWILTQ